MGPYHLAQPSEGHINKNKIIAGIKRGSFTIQMKLAVLLGPLALVKDMPLLFK